MSESEASEGRDLEARYKPSGVAHSTFMPFRPETSNPLKKLESADWNLYVIDLVSSWNPTDRAYSRFWGVLRGTNWIASIERFRPT